VLVTVPVWILVALNGGPTWLWIVLGVGAATWLQGFISVNLRIRRHAHSGYDRCGQVDCCAGRLLSRWTRHQLMSFKSALCHGSNRASETTVDPFGAPG
jgi:hypothetical protein